MHACRGVRFELSLLSVCRYHIRSATLQLAIKGCSFECYKEIEAKRCCPGYWGQDCIECPEHASMPCNNNGVCSDGMGGNGTCSCKDGYTGTACEDCAPNRYGSTCGSVCTCVHGLCNAGVRGDGICTCFSGYKGPNCDQELPECAALSCPENSRCMEEALTGKLVCRCKTGYQICDVEWFLLSSLSSAINPCLQSICHPHATCVHTGPNKHLCTCAEGYSGDGRVCMGIDPCQTNHGGCSALSTRCVYDGPGKFHCECLAGFDNLERGVSCSLKEACKPDSCHKNANCTTVAPERVESVIFYLSAESFKTNMASLMDLPGPFTVFAPTSTAFDAMMEGHLQYLSSAEGYIKLVELLRNHIVASSALEVYNVVSSPRVVTRANQVLSFNVTENGQILVNGMAVLEADVEAKNGRLYSVDGVLIPSSIEPVLPHRCDTTETKIGECVSCSKAKLAKCPSGVFMVRPLSIYFSLSLSLCLSLFSSSYTYSM
uniref:Stabilin 2 n=1 Tax=Myripristis murdjan TaxID=586833 RepID=A0A667ZAU2_9TELE